LPKLIAMDWFIRHRVAGNRQFEVDNYVKNFARTLAKYKGIPFASRQLVDVKVPLTRIIYLAGIRSNLPEASV
jgi:hypothetical protein